MRAEDVTPDRTEHDTEHDTERDAQRVASRSELLPEEKVAGSEDPQTQAEVILEDSEERTEVPNAAPATHLERRTSAESV